MKRALASVCAAALALSMVACGSTTSSSTSESSSAAAGDSSSTSAAAATVSGTVTASGSSALQPLAQKAAEEFNTANPDCSVTVNGGGSGTGLQQVADGTVDIGNSDVDAESKLDADVAATLVDHRVCVVTMAAVVNKDVGITDLTKDQLKDIFTAKITNWSEVGGPDEEIILVTRPSSSGTRALFQEYALDGEEEASNAALETDDSGTLLQNVSQNAGAIGYVALPYIMNNDDVQPVAIDGVEPSLENTYNGSYPVWGYEHMYTNGEGSEAAQAFINYVMSDEFAPEIEALGYGVTSKMTVER
ncbi:phosphate ABC transporter substrate-binding protein [uncultured Gemmiger sp.]|uniref:phosphate ABC transporter substrate-binding protein n=1 Tax=uncultured Gemmiger sp. TaxID=1623490 RepID=UPI0025CD7732|nr:phosphate ABC transporter substrate-binding protein [uncultured Gemmiger sp.]